jgi:hypothetical protein
MVVPQIFFWDRESEQYWMGRWHIRLELLGFLKSSEHRQIYNICRLKVWDLVLRAVLSSCFLRLKTDWPAELLLSYVVLDSC